MLEDIRAAQAQGVIDPEWDPADLLAIVAALAGAWSNATRSLARLAETEGPPVERRRAVIEEAVRRIIKPLEI